MPEHFSSFNKSQNSLKQYSQRGFSVKGTSLSNFVWLQEILTRLTTNEDWTMNTTERSSL